MRKKVDSRIRELIEASVQARHRSLILMVGDHGRDQVVNLHYMLSKASVRARPSVLWCYKNELGFSSNRKKRMKQITKLAQRGLLDVNRDDPFELFVSSTQIRFCFYSESHKVLGNTYGMCVLQDFEALTPNLLARTIETVEGGGMVVILLRTMGSLRQLYSLAMDAHSKLRTESHAKIVARFNERFLLSLSACAACLVCDDELNVLPLTSSTLGGRRVAAAAAAAANGMAEGANALGGGDADVEELTQLQHSMADVQPIGALLKKTRTVDQARALLTFATALSEKTLRTTVSLTAARGRGKSAALGLAVAAAIFQGYSNIFVTSPAPDNLTTFFSFLFVGFDALEYLEHVDYEIHQAAAAATAAHSGGGAGSAASATSAPPVLRVNVFRTHRQTVQYVAPADAAGLARHAELFVIDEAAAIPLPIVRDLLGPYLVFLSSTVTGYEGTGRSLSLKLLAQLRRSSGAGGGASSAGRELREVDMDAPVRYARGDPVEAWLYDVLCLDVGVRDGALTHHAAHPSQCELYRVDRDALFSRHAAAEAFLRRVMALFVSSHYKNSPNDLLLLADAPAHDLFVLLGPTSEDTARLPDVLCAIQVCSEGGIARHSVRSSLSRSTRPHGDLIPWTLAQQFQDTKLAELRGVRVVRIATHPSVQSMGYGSWAMQQLLGFYRDGAAGDGGDGDGERSNDVVSTRAVRSDDGAATSLLEERLAPRSDVPPLLRRLSELSPPPLEYVGVSFGLSGPLHNFWSRLGFRPFYVRLTPNELTAEHTTIVLAELQRRRRGESPADGADDGELLRAFRADFRRRFATLLGYEFRSLPPGVALTLLQDNASDTRLLTAGGGGGGGGAARSAVPRRQPLRERLSAYDLRRLEAYSRSLVDYHVVLDLLPALADAYFDGEFGDALSLSAAQNAILMSIGLQRKSVDDLEKELDLPANQILALFGKTMRRLSKQLREEDEHAAERELTAGAADGNVRAFADASEALGESLEADLEAAATELAERGRGDANESGPAAAAAASQRKPHHRHMKLLESAAMKQYAVTGDDEDWNAALGDARGSVKSVSMRSKRPPNDDATAGARDGAKSRRPSRTRKHGSPGDGDPRNAHKKKAALNRG